MPNSFPWNGAAWNGAAWNGVASAAALLAPMSIDDRTYPASWEDVRTLVLASFAMTRTNERIRNVVIGDDKRIKRTLTGLPTGYTAATAWLTIKRSARQLDADAIVQKEITASPGADGAITTASTSGGSIVLYFDLSSTDTALFKPDIEYPFDIQVRLATGEDHTLVMGTISFIRGVTANA